MNFGFRYHLASLMAIFLSLFLGILIGAVLFQDSALVEEQGLLITEMELRFQELETNLITAHQKISQAENVGNILRDLVIKDQLTGKVVYLLTEDASARHNNLTKILKQAGAEVKLRTQDQLENLLEMENSIIVTPLSNQAFQTKILDSLAQMTEVRAYFAFVWPGEIRLDQASLPNALYLDNGDTLLGEIGLVLGLANQSIGHYGLQDGAKGLLP